MSLSRWPPAGDLGKWTRKCRAAVHEAHEVYLMAGPPAGRPPRPGGGAGAAGARRLGGRGRWRWLRRQARVMALAARTRQRLTLTVACMAQVMMVLDVLIVTVALPSMQHELHLSPAGLEWVVSAYALALAALIPLGG